jgi:phytanoyl-CoA hydroxylase
MTDQPDLDSMNPTPSTAERDGYFLVRGLLDPTSCRGYAERLQEYAAARRTPPAGVALQREPVLERAGQTRLDGGDIRKISWLYADDLFRNLISHPAVVRTVGALVGMPVRLFRADALMKPAGVGSEKGVHQDAPYWPVAPMSMWSIWTPFDPATLDNGCLTVLPGSHLNGPRPHVRTQDDFVVAPEHYDAADLVPLPMAPGDVLFFHSLLVHGSAANVSGQPRRAVTISYLGPDHRHTGDGAPPSYPTVGGT